MKKRALAALLALILCLSCFCIPSQAASSVKQEDVELQLINLMKQYCGTYWREYYYGATQCKGFADMIADKLYGLTGGPGPYSDSRYYLPNAESRGYKKIGILAPGDCTPENLRALFRKARPGDYVQCVRYTGTQHSLIVADVHTTGVTFFDCNLKGSYLCASYFYDWEEVGATFTRGCSLYRYSKYVASDASRVIFNANGGTCSMTSKNVSAGSAFGALPTPERKGYKFDYWYVISCNSGREPDRYKVNANTVKTSLYDTIIFAHWTKDGGTCALLGHTWTKSKTVAATCTENGYDVERCSVCGETRNTNITSALGHSWSKEKTVAATCTDKGYVLERCSACGETRNTNVTAALGHDWKLLSTKEATNIEDGEELYQCTRCGNYDRKVILCQLNSFADLSKSAWYYSYVRDMVSYALMNGTSKTAFSPNKSLTRAMLVTILWRMEGEPQVMPSGFGDVVSGKWYAGAVDWGSCDGIIYGYPDASFRPDDAITREQAAVILYRYYLYVFNLEPGSVNTSNLSKFSDSAKVSAYAKEAVSWAISNGILSGYPDGTLGPRGEASRAQIAKMIITFRSKFAAE